MRRQILAAALLGLLAAPAARAGDDDHERARHAVEAGRILPLVRLLAEIERRFVGQVVETELDDDDDDRWTYEFKLLPPSGRMYKVELDAATGAVIGTKGPVQERR
ncbi:hypothetical protein E2C06_02690 [Dankookia rubra]|uniref:PepSY domain-containing protein n=1 Tax=Dankookia rubra TaxID=1442381 RepID=A0A4R5QL76_9PROT|nr:PepSY domain-containing protein [Dankookia rubra]TDH64264.1 hypothetical protein E2C06_02690 [Dankookia rubra]